MALFVLNLAIGLNGVGTLLPGQGWLLLCGGALYVVAGPGMAGHFWARLAPSRPRMGRERKMGR
jgi:hypothetical protein